MYIGSVYDRYLDKHGAIGEVFVSTAYPECEDVAGLMDAGEDASDTNGGLHLHVAADIAPEKHKHTITTEIQ